MAQAQMQKTTTATKEAVPASVGPTMAGVGGTQTPMTETKMKWWIWLIIAIVVIGAGVGIYYWLM